MSAREQFFEAMAGGWSLTAAEAEGLNRVIDDFAHGLAEEQRAYAREVGVPLGDGDTVSAGDVIDLIDPHASAGPVRPDEEGTA
ncbi:hypothetical protein [Streptomyces sp. 1222.5]|uniref:hypothetical protein n=1 Tax=Streptomyces sp. 1222.5 TaxID=1881026 RepID=UPI003EBB18A9